MHHQEDLRIVPTLEENTRLLGCLACLHSDTLCFRGGTWSQNVPGVSAHTSEHGCNAPLFLFGSCPIFSRRRCSPSDLRPGRRVVGSSPGSTRDSWKGVSALIEVSVSRSITRGKSPLPSSSATTPTMSRHIDELAQSPGTSCNSGDVSRVAWSHGKNKSPSWGIDVLACCFVLFSFPGQVQGS